jgi:hypothetical protein
VLGKLWITIETMIEMRKITYADKSIIKLSKGVYGILPLKIPHQRAWFILKNHLIKDKNT